MNGFKLVAIMAALSASSVSFAKSASNLSITPIVGLERVQKLLPTPSMKTRAILGVTAIYKLPITALEAEYTHGQDTSTEAATNTSYKDEADKLKLGLRGQFDIGTILSSYLRGGAQVKKSKTTRSVSGTSSTTTSTTKVNPYAGTGVAIHLAQFFSLNADITAVYTPTSTAGLKDYELQPSIGFTISI